MHWTRRRFLKTLGLSTAAFSLGTNWMPQAWAETASSRRFIFCYFSGGWDILLCLDPRSPADFPTFNPGTSVIKFLEPGFKVIYSVLHQPQGKRQLSLMLHQSKGNTRHFPCLLELKIFQGVWLIEI